MLKLTLINIPKFLFDIFTGGKNQHFKFQRFEALVSRGWSNDIVVVFNTMAARFILNNSTDNSFYY